VPVAQFIGDSVLRIGDTDFHYEHPLTDVPAGHLGIEKLRPLLESYLDLWEELRPRRVVELGIHSGGSTALIHELGVERVVSVELAPTRVDALDRFVAERGATDAVRPHYGVDQADREALARIVDEEFAGAPLDLVIDDASHLYRESRASFEVLFPRVRPGGLYLLEDWRWQHMVAAGMAAAIGSDGEVRRHVEQRIAEQGRLTPETPMSRLVLELVIARAIGGEAVGEVAVGADWAAVRRGVAPLDPATFRVDDCAPDHLGVLATVR
jgi:predicted O-methyltransferase YrrM